MQEDLYRVLGVSEDATTEKIESAFRDRTAELANVSAGRDPGLDERRRAIAMAFEILRKPATRKAYDRVGKRVRENTDDLPRAPSQSARHTGAPGQAKRSIGESARFWDRIATLLRGEVAPSKVIGFGIVLPFVASVLVAGFTRNQVLFHVPMLIWTLCGGVVLFRAAGKSARAIGRWAIRSLAMIVIAWNALVLFGAGIGSLTRSNSVSASADSVDPGCFGVTNAILAAAIPPRAAEIGHDAEFIKTPEGRLVDAAFHGRMSDVRTLLDQGVDLNTQDKRGRFYGNNSLHHAARSNNVELAKLLIERGMNVDAPGPTGYSPLHVASGLGQLKMVGFLADHGANLTQYDKGSDTTPLQIAVIQGKAKTVELLLEKGAAKFGKNELAAALRSLTRADTHCPSQSTIVATLIKAGVDLAEVDSSNRPLFLSVASRDDNLAFAIIKNASHIDWTQPVTKGALTIPTPPIVDLACGRAQGKAAIYLLSESKDKESIRRAAVGPWGSPLHCLGENKYKIDFVRFLLDQGFDPNGKDASGRTPIHSSPDRDISNLLISRGADVKSGDIEGKTPLHFAAARGFSDRVKVLLDAGADVNTTDRHGRTPIFFASGDAVFETLVSAGATADFADDTGNTALIFLMNAKNRPPSRGELQALINARADIRARDTNGATACHIAAKRATHLLEPILARDPKCVALTDTQGRTSMHYAAIGGSQGAADLLVKAGGELNARDSEGNTPLHLAVQNENADFVRDALKLGAKTGVKNRQGLIPADVIQEGKHSTKWLKETLGPARI